MRPEVAAAERLHAVRAAARSWKKAGWVSGEAERQIAARFADDRQRQGVALRTLLWLFTVFAVSSALGTVSAFVAGVSRAFEEPTWAILLVAAGIACAFLAELGYGSMRLLDFGPESALSWCAVGMTLSGTSWLLFEIFEPKEQLGILICLGIAAVLFALGAWRWGSWMMAMLAGLALLGILAGLPWGRVAWLVVGLATAPLWFRASIGESTALAPPSRRRTFAALLLLATAAAAAAVFPAGIEGNWIEKLGLRPTHVSPIPLAIGWVLSWLLAAGLLVLGIRRRRLLVLHMGALLTALLTAGALDAMDARPAWLVLIVAGGGLVAGALVLRRWLDSGADQERGGFTTAALLEDPASRRALEAAITIATATPEARPLPAAQPAPTVSGQGGQFGGGGSSSDF